MFDNLKNMASVLGQAKQIRQKIEELQGELGKKTVEGQAGAGAVRVVANGRLEVITVRLDPLLLVTLTGAGDDADHQMVEELIAAATNAALLKARGLIQQEVSRLTGGLDMSGLAGLTGLPGVDP